MNTLGADSSLLNINVKNNLNSASKGGRNKSSNIEQLNNNDGGNGKNNLNEKSEDKINLSNQS